MANDRARLILAGMVIVGFYGIVLLVLLGLVNIESPEIAKLVGALFGYFTAMLTPILQRYFKEDDRT